MRKLVYGVGINDVNYVVKPVINGKRVSCPYYQKWIPMLSRCYSDQFHTVQPTYIGCEVSDEWKTFSKFKAWMEKQDWVGKELDKDILFPDNKIYSENTCVFVSQNVNKFLTERQFARGLYMLGVYWHSRIKKFGAQCHDGNGNQRHLGYFDNELEAHITWKAYKHKVACKLADEQSDPRVAKALRERFAPETNKELI